MKTKYFTILICVQIIFLCTLFFAIGYGKAYQQAVNYANEFIDDNCIKKIGYEDIAPVWEKSLFDFEINITGGNEENG